MIGKMSKLVCGVIQVDGRVKEQWTLINKISKGEISKKEVEREMERLEDKYGKDAFLFITILKRKDNIIKNT